MFLFFPAPSTSTAIFLAPLTPEQISLSSFEQRHDSLLSNVLLDEIQTLQHAVRQLLSVMDKFLLKI